MRISEDFETLLNNFDSADVLNVTNATSLRPQESGQKEAIKLVVDAEKSFTSTTFFAVQAVDDVGNRGAVSNIVSIVVAKGYRVKAKPGTFDVETEPEVITKITKDKDSLVNIIAGAVGGTVFMIICIIALLLCKRQRTKVISIRKKGYDFSTIIY